MLTTEVIARAARLDTPIAAHLDITELCNENCLHCYSCHFPEQLAADEICTVLDQLAAAGVLFLTLSGGEPFLRPDLFAILHHARRLRFWIQVKTNGTLIGAETARRLRSLLVNRVDVSLYSARAEIHDAITQRPGSLAKTLEAIRLMRGQSIHVVISHIITTLNSGEYASVLAIAREFNATFQFNATITRRLNGDSTPLHLNIGADLRRALARDPLLSNRGDADCDPKLAPVDETALGDLLCNAAHSLCYISPRGDVWPCIQYPLPVGNIRRQSFQSIWSGSDMARIRKLRVRDLPHCSRCSHVSICRHCPGLALQQGDVLGPSHLNCAEAAALTGIEPSFRYDQSHPS